MAGKKKYHWYVLVMSNDGPKFVTKINWADKTAEWDYKEAPLELDKSTAQDLAWALTLNWHIAFAVCTQFEVSGHPYIYDRYDLQFVEKEAEDESISD